MLSNALSLGVCIGLSFPDRAPKRLLLQRPVLAAVSMAEVVCLGIGLAGSGLTREKADNQKGGGQICYRPFTTSLLRCNICNIGFEVLQENILTWKPFTSGGIQQGGFESSRHIQLADL